MLKSGTNFHTTGHDSESRVLLQNATPLRIELHPQGRVFAIRHERILINQLLPDNVEQGLLRLMLRIQRPDGSFSTLQAWGPDSSFWSDGRTCAVWSNTLSGELQCTTTLTLHPTLPAWAYHVAVHHLSSDPSLNVQTLLVQDIGLAEQAALRMNEAYNSHYVDMEPLRETTGPNPGWVVCARQNQADSQGKFPWLMMGCAEGAAHYATDAFQVFGADYRFTGSSHFEAGHQLPDQRLQYECSVIALQTGSVTLAPASHHEHTFFARFIDSHPGSSCPEDLNRLRELKPFHWVKRNPPALAAASVPARSLFETCPLLHGQMADPSLLERWFPGRRRFEEHDRKSGALLSFFHDGNCHVVTREKEIQTQRPHGHILRSGDTDWVDGDHLGVTCYADGMFGAQCFYGNPNLALLYSVRRNALNLQRSSGQRIFVKTADQWTQLGIPTFFEMGIASARWVYCLEDREIEVSTTCARDQAMAVLQVRVARGQPCAFLVTHRLVLGSAEGDSQGEGELYPELATAVLRPAKNSFVAEKLPELGFVISAVDPCAIRQIGMDALLYETEPEAGEREGSRNFLVFQTYAVSEFALRFAGTASISKQLLGDRLSESMPLHSADPTPFGLEISTAPTSDVQKLAEILPWFNHNAGIHFSSPHGLEQYGGAAWGVRDVCQGSMEWLLASGRYAVARRILIEVFSHQYVENGNWPQWFMHGEFSSLQQVHAHGDICFWPVKALCDYLEASNDFTILTELVDYTSCETLAGIARPETLLQHCDRMLVFFESRLSDGTLLVNYGEGDWDDTLQPADRSMCTRMVSAWTVALSFHVFRQFREVCYRAGDPARQQRMQHFLDAIQKDFREHLMRDGTVAGFGVREQSGFRLLLHPEDEVTGIHYRLLPMTRSILAELFDAKEAQHHLELIKQHLLFADGARLMDRPATYKGGVEQLFKRADTAANVGREIGLMYVHAHIRYAEALAKVGDAEALWKALRVMNPILLHEVVPNAEIRQANAFFSSSDADFPDRYAAKANWDQLHEGTVSVKGGWRIYSSSPGLFLNKVRCSLLGLRESFDELVIDPVLPNELDGLTVDTLIAGKPIRIRYLVKTRNTAPQSILLNSVALDCSTRQANPYREGGVRVSRAFLLSRLSDVSNQMEIRL